MSMKNKQATAEFLLTPNLDYFTPNFLSLTPTFCNVSTEKYSKTSTFLEDSTCILIPIFKIHMRTLGQYFFFKI